MAVTELAFLRLKAQNPTSSTKTTLLRAQNLQIDYSGYQVTYLHQVEDPTSFYLLGGWESIEKHTGGGQWTSSETNQKLLAELKDSLYVSWVLHLDVDLSASRIPLDAPVIAIDRLFVKADRKKEFEVVFENARCALGAHAAPFSYCGAWRLDKEGEDEEFVLFTGWRSVDDHSKGGNEATNELKKLMAMAKGVEGNHTYVEKWE